jgi:hypothetical protein
MIGGCLTTSSLRFVQVRSAVVNLPLCLVITLVMLVWGVASEALREIITSFLDEVRFD